MPELSDLLRRAVQRQRELIERLREESSRIAREREEELEREMERGREAPEE
jgi:hypothetical protein